jgi:hypothetical protein
MTPELVARLDRVESALARVCRDLVAPSPAVLDGCSRTLESAFGELREFRRGLEGRAEPEARARLLKLRASLRLASRLLDTAAEFHTGWSRILGAMTGGYTPEGSAAVLTTRPRVCLEG